MPTDTKLLPPLTRTLCKFLAGVQLPTPPKHGPNPNMDYALLLSAMAWFPHRNVPVPENARSISCSPSLKQLAQIMHCSSRTVQRIIEALRLLGFISIRRRGNRVANVFTIFQRPQRSDTTTVVHSENPDIVKGDTPKKGDISEARRDNSTFRVDNSVVLSGQLDVLTRQQLSSSGLDLLDSKELSGEDLLGKATAKSKPAPSFLKSQSQSQNLTTTEIRDLESFLLEIGCPGSRDEIKSIVSNIAAVAIKRQITRTEALAEFKSRLRSMIKMPQPKRQRSKAEREYAHQLAREEEESAQYEDDRQDEYGEEEPVF